MQLSDIAVVLCRPDESRNIGASCRAMANCGINSLRIVGSPADYDDAHIRVLAIHAAPIWENAAFFSSITEASADCVLAAGTTRRRGKRRKGRLLFPEEFAQHAAKIPDGKIALVFGNERTGLTDVELEECTMGVTIPASDDFSSLNLSHAVQILCYALFRELLPRMSARKSPSYTPIPLSRLDKTVDGIVGNLRKIGFFTQREPHEMELFWKAILARAALSESEAAYLERIFAKASGLAGKQGGGVVAQ